jgi:protein-S-isoprenylcysteine O-methyltransferase Ste14
VTTIFSLIVTFMAQVLVLLYPGVLAFWLIIHCNIERWRRMGSRAYSYATLVWPVTGAIILFFRASLFSLRWPPPAWLIALGVAALVAAAWLGALASRVISKKTLVGVPELKPQTNKQPLMRSGIYARTRNPIYLAHSLLIFAAAALTGFAANWGLLILDALLLPIMIRAEERELLKRYGAEYRAYMQATPRFFP